jgi:hypothetical protein
MIKLKEAAALALDALEECQYATTSKADKMVDVAMKALRAALAEPEPYDQQALELCHVCGWKTVMPGESCLMCSHNARMLHEDALETAAEPEPTGERAELIRQLRDVLGKSVHVDIANEAANMLEADAGNDDLTIAYMAGFKAGKDKNKADGKTCAQTIRIGDAR